MVLCVTMPLLPYMVRDINCESCGILLYFLWDVFDYLLGCSPESTCLCLAALSERCAVKFTALPPIG